MDYRYTEEDDMSVAINITLRDIDHLVNILEPVSKDTEHKSRWRAQELHDKLADTRKKMLVSALESLQYKLDALE